MSSAPAAKFVTGSTMRHVVTMTATGSIGLVAIFVVDALNLFYIARLGQKELAAAVGYAGTILFFFTSIGIGLSIAATALTSRALGRGDRVLAKELASASLFVSVAVAALLSVAIVPFLPAILTALGAQGLTAQMSLRFMHIVLPSVSMLSFAMSLTGLLRALGDAKGAMYVTLGAGGATAVLDPLFIFDFGLGLGLDGAAYANVLARIVMVGMGIYSLFGVHHLYSWPRMDVFRRELKPYLAIGIPAILTQIATPVGNTFVTAAMAKYGDDAVAGWAIIGRLTPVAFGVIFALSGAVGPILGQNMGAGLYDRLRSVMRDSLIVMMVYVAAVWLLMALLSHHIADSFAAHGLGRELVIFFCIFVSGSFIFNGILFVANAAFNNLGFAFYSTLLNWGRSTLGVLPFVWLGGEWFGATGVLAGYGLGVVFFGIAGGLLCFRVLHRLGPQKPAS